ncbi:type IV pilus assembly protein PilC [Amphibacillus marinus]|uniref:Type IV pilus assembly protein PilC n=1 Tax=Amphibacillus marinus TaxID=872970 RepID=A0A1H8TSB4_9BACI|nr:type II secretion system F family protein [Amphibacillus marinus]SEO93735.1 type IV pilus assembly protein PilC [Amphibacillus marinus]
MPLYAYQARTLDGKYTKGKLESDTEKNALSELKQLNLLVFDIKKLNAVLYQDIRIGSPIKNKDFVIFLRQFSTLVDAGITLVNATEILSEQSNSKVLAQALIDVKESIKEGQPLSEALADYPKLFPELLVSMINAGEVSGRLDEILDRMATYYEKQYLLKQKVITALTYPIVIGILSLFITMFLLAFIVPVFTDMFLSFDQEIPAYTAFILSISGFFQQFWWLIILLLALVITAIKLLLKRDRFAYQFDLLKLKLPIFGMFVQKATLARMTQTLSSLLNSSVPIIQAVEITERVIENRVVKEVLAQSKIALEQGESLAKPMEAHWVFPQLVTQMVAVGEATGSMDDMLKKVATFYEQELEEASDKLKALIEPILIVFLSFVVGAIVLAIVIPMFNLFESF